MNIPAITVVAGLPGCGKTTWIYQQLAVGQQHFHSTSGNVLYYSPGTGSVPIDQTYLATKFPQVKVFDDTQTAEFVNQLTVADAIYMEVGFYLELSTVEKILNNLPYSKVAVLPPNLKDSEWYSWASEIVAGVSASKNLSKAQLWRVSNTGQVFDENSLEEFWYEMTHGAYGTVVRAKGIFDVADGRSLYADFVEGVQETDLIELDLPRHLEGRPHRFSGVEVLGENLDEVALGQTLQDCCLSDAAILYYQEQAKESLKEEMVR
ncbi:GTP-binding protein [Scytonema sp. NUACC26]|uniref:GTP-binding protein n=1 Tax=Scytonema sp. NUACC26 TaxID=3140176 RepID=UPI0034DC2AC1